MIHSRYRLNTAIAAMSIFSSTFVSAAEVTPRDLGPLAEATGNQSIAVTLALRLSDEQGAESLLSHVSMPDDPLFQHFLTPQEFAAKFGPSSSTVQSVTRYLQAHGLAVEQLSATIIRTTGSPAAFEQLFQTSLHQFQAPATPSGPVYTYHAPTLEPVVPAAISSSVTAVLGLDSSHRLRPNSAHASFASDRASVPKPTAGGDAPGLLTVNDFAAHYDVNPLYAKGITGAGQTLGIVTLASFTPSDVFGYWSSIGLNVNPNRISVVNVDGGPPPPPDDFGGQETALDLEQSGGIAPGAKIVVYEAPNTNQGFVDVLATAVQANQVSMMSTSWSFGMEFSASLANAPVTDPNTGQTVSAMQAMHEVLVQAALQGQTVITAAGDNGAYGVLGSYEGSNYSIPLSVTYPASDPAITTGGGTTLAGPQSYSTPSGTITVDVPAERVWGWDYMEPVCAAEQLGPLTCGVFPYGGTGGGVSMYFPIPAYQQGISGVRSTQPGQALVDSSTTPPTTIVALPANYAGRNIPDYSFNTDPNTGYTVPFTSTTGFSVMTNWGGTSFAAPQFNGVMALVAQQAGHRFGLINPLLYCLAQRGAADWGAGSLFHAIATGDNWFYKGRNGYSPAAGLGTIDVANFADYLK